MRIDEKFDLDKLFFTSDLHFFHDNIIKYCSRPFANALEMNEQLIYNWNEVVPDDGNVFMAGDFIHTGRIESVQNIVDKLNGKIWWILGNHCYQSRHDRKIVSDIVQGRQMDVATVLIKNDNDQRLFISHYPHLYWLRDTWHLHGHCISEDSEILTNNGWKKYNTIDKDLDLVYSDSGDGLTLEKIDNLIINENYSGTIYRSNMKSVNVNVTDKHKMCYFSAHNGKKILKYVDADKMFGVIDKKFFRLSGKYNNVGIGWSEDILKLYILLVADGSVNKKTNLGRIKVGKIRKINYIKPILDRLNLKYSENIQKDGAICFNFQMPIEFIDMTIKGLDDIILKANKFDAENILEAYEYSDGYRNGNNVIIYSNKESEIELLQHLFVINGYSACKYTRNHGFSNTIGHQLCINEREIVSVRNLKTVKPEVVENKLYWCIQTKHTNFFTRLNGKVHLTGNCHTGPNSTSNEKPPFHSLRYDIGVDNNEYKPISYQQVKDIINKQKEL